MGLDKRDGHSQCRGNGKRNRDRRRLGGSDQPGRIATRCSANGRRGCILDFQPLHAFNQRFKKLRRALRQPPLRSENPKQLPLAPIKPMPKGMKEREGKKQPDGVQMERQQRSAPAEKEKSSNNRLEDESDEQNPVEENVDGCPARPAANQEAPQPRFAQANAVREIGPPDVDGISHERSNKRDPEREVQIPDVLSRKKEADIGQDS